MKAPERFRSIVAGSILVAFAMALAACQKTPRDESKTKGHAVFVVVTYDSASGKAQILEANSEKSITLRKKKDWVVWYSVAGRVDVTFAPGQSPFEKEPAYDSEKKLRRSGTSDKPGIYNYDIALIIEGQPGQPSTTVNFDPQIEVME
jgi:hypothetical protein